MTETAQPPQPVAVASAHPGFLDKVGAALHHGEAEAARIISAVEGDAAKARHAYLEHAATVHEAAALALRELQAADPGQAAAIERILAVALPAAESAARIAGAVLAAL